MDKSEQALKDIIRYIEHAKRGAETRARVGLGSNAEDGARALGHLEAAIGNLDNQEHLNSATQAINEAKKHPNLMNVYEDLMEKIDAAMAQKKQQRSQPAIKMTPGALSSPHKKKDGLGARFKKGIEKIKQKRDEKKRQKAQGNTPSVPKKHR